MSSQTTKRDLEESLATTSARVGQYIAGLNSGFQPAPLTKTLVIGLGHKARHGKDYVAKFLARNYGIDDIRIIGFADALKTYCRVAFGMTEKDPRLLQLVGTEIFRAKDPDIWVRTLYYTAKELEPGVLLIPDMRFPNEAAFVKAVGGFTLKVTRLEADGKPYVSPDRDPKHASEIALDDYDSWDDQIIASSGGLRLLEAQAANIYAKFCKAAGRRMWVGTVPSGDYVPGVTTFPLSMTPAPADPVTHGVPSHDPHDEHRFDDDGGPHPRVDFNDGHQ